MPNGYDSDILKSLLSRMGSAGGGTPSKTLAGTIPQEMPDRRDVYQKELQNLPTFEGWLASMGIRIQDLSVQEKNQLYQQFKETLDEKRGTITSRYGQGDV